MITIWQLALKLKKIDRLNSENSGNMCCYRPNICFPPKSVSCDLTRSDGVRRWSGAPMSEGPPKTSLAPFFPVCGPGGRASPVLVP